MAALHSRCGHYIFALWFLLSFFPHLISAVADWMCAILQTWCGLSANLGCRSEMCCTWLAEKYRTQKNCQKFGSIVQLCQVISSQLRHVSTIGKKLVKQQYLFQMSDMLLKLQNIFL